MNYTVRKKQKEDCLSVAHVVTVAWNETYKEKDSLKLLIDSVATRITDNLLSSALEYYILDEPTVYQDIDEQSKNVELCMNDVENVLCGPRYERVLKEVPVDEFLDLIQKELLVDDKKKQRKNYR